MVLLVMLLLLLVPPLLLLVLLLSGAAVCCLPCTFTLEGSTVQLLNILKLPAPLGTWASD